MVNADGFAGFSRRQQRIGTRGISPVPGACDPGTQSSVVGERGQVTLDVSPDLLRRQVTLVGSWTFSKQGQAECAEFVADRKVDVERLFTHRWRLEQAEEAYRLFDTQTTGKAVILPS
jgi:threonine dehydrogenase-like Zn-dependent dehydrogenase